MAIRSPQDYGPRPDYAGGIGQALGGVAKAVNDFSPAHPMMAQALRRIYGGEDPRAVAIETKFAMSRQQPPPALPDAGIGAPTPSPGAPALRGSMRSSMGGAPDQGAFTGPNEFTSEETVTAPPPPQRGSMPLMSDPSTPQAFYSQAQPPILNRDLPMLMQGANLAMKEDKSDLAYLNYLLGRDRLATNQDQFGRMEVHRGIRDTATKANTAEIPIRREQANRRLGISAFNAQTGRGNLDTRRTENFLKGTAETAQAIPQLRSVLSTLRNSPGVAPPDWDYATRKMGRIMGGLPFIGDSLKEGFEVVADTALTPEQRQIRARIAQAVQPYRKLAVGTQITPGEFALLDQITGQGLSVGDQIAALMALERSMAARQGRYEAGYPEMPGRIPMASPDQVMPPIQNPYPTGFELPTLPDEGVR